jgi:hypothetical protein
MSGVSVSALLSQRDQIRALAGEAIRYGDLAAAVTISREVEALQGQIDHCLRFPTPIKIAPAGAYRLRQVTSKPAKTRNARQSVTAKPLKEKAPPKPRTPKALKVVAAPPGAAREKECFTTVELDAMFAEQAAA